MEITFLPILSQDFFWSNVVMVDGEISKSDGQSRSYDGYATSMGCPPPGWAMRWLGDGQGLVVKGG